MDLLVQSSKVLPQSSPKHGQVVTGIPYYAGTNLSQSGILFLYKHHDQEASWKWKGFIELTFAHCCSSLKEFRTGTQAGQEAGADAEAT